MRFLVVLPLVLAICGCHVKAGLDKGEATKEAKQEKVAPAPAPPPQNEPVIGKGDGKGIIGKMTDEVVDFEKAMAENPNLIEVDPKAKGDYLSFMASAYINVRSKVSMLGMEQELNMIKQVEGRNPSYDEIKKIMKQYKIEFTMLPSYQKYSYDAKKGRFVILEDPAKRAAVHGE